MSKFKTIIRERVDLPNPKCFSILSPDGRHVLFTGTLSQCWDKREFFERKYLKYLPEQLEFDFDEI